MKKLVTIVLLVVASLTGFSQSYNNCLTKTKTVWGEMCGSSSSYQVWFRNDCSITVDVKVCLKKTDGKWSCGVEYGLRPGETTDDGFWACSSTGNVLYWAKDTDSDAKFPTDSEINSRY
jgi:hypothetical protein